MNRNNQKGFSTIMIMITIVIVALIVLIGYSALNNNSVAPNPAPIVDETQTPAPSQPDPIQDTVPETNGDTVSISLGQEFTLKEGQVAKITNSGLEIEIVKFHNNPCEGVCVWSGVGIEFEYRFNGQVQQGIDLSQAFGYQTTVANTDHKTFANLVIKRI